MISQCANKRRILTGKITNDTNGRITHSYPWHFFTFPFIWGFLFRCQHSLLLFTGSRVAGWTEGVDVLMYVSTTYIIP
jgi:hypothetical protein